jgi:hypothetical protein
MSDVVTTVLSAFPVVAMAAAIVLVPLVGHPPSRPRRNKSGRHFPL